MELKFTQFSQAPTIRSTVCQRCGYRMFQTKAFIWVCGPDCNGAEQWYQLQMKEDSFGKRVFTIKEEVKTQGAL